MVAAVVLFGVYWLVVVNPAFAAGTKENTTRFRPGNSMHDQQGRPIQAHAAGLLRHGDVWYWYGQDMTGRRTPQDSTLFMGISVYCSPDLQSWSRLGLALPPEEGNTNSPLYKDRIVERAKVIHNLRTGKFVMWMHLDDRNYTRSQAGVAVADKPEGPFKLICCFRPIPAEADMHPDDARQQTQEGCPVLDMNLFVDNDGQAYVIYTSEGLSTLHIVQLNDDFTDIRRPAVRGRTWNRMLAGQTREAPALFRWREHVYLFSSGCTGYEPNFLQVARAPSPLGPWEVLGDPCIGPDAETGYQSQPAWVLPVPEQGPDSFVYIGDRWKQNDLASTRPVWLPFRMGLEDKPCLRFLPEWSLDIFAHRAKPPAVRNLSARLVDSRGTQIQPDLVELSWEPAARADGYSVYRNGHAIGFTSGTTYTAALGLPGVPSCFAVRAWNLAGGTADSVEARTDMERVPFGFQTCISGAGGSVFTTGRVREVYVSDVPWVRTWSAFCRIIKDQAWDGGALRIGAQCYFKGLLAHAPAEIVIDLGGVYARFESEVGMLAGFPGAARFRVRGDGRVLTQTEILREGMPPQPLSLDVTGIHELVLEVMPVGRGTLDGRAVWGAPRLRPTT